MDRILPRMETTDNQPVDMECFKIVHQLLRHNHTSFDVRYSICYTNHTAHVLYAYLDLGANANHIKHWKAQQPDRLRPLSAPQLCIHRENWLLYRGEPSYYSAYLAYFEREIDRLGYRDTLNTYISHIISGLLGAVGHPVIHLGVALAHQDPMILSEALAFSCAAEQSPVPLAEMMYLGTGQRIHLDGYIRQVLDQLAQDVRLDKFKWQHPQVLDQLQPLLNEYSDIIFEYFHTIAIDEGNVLCLIDELVYLTTELLLSTAPYGSLDFFIAHLVTTSHAIQIIAPHLKIDDLVRLLRGYWLYMILVYICQGRPTRLPITQVKQAPTWSEIVQQTLLTSDEHVPKLIVAWRHAARRSRACGHEDDWWRYAAAILLSIIEHEDQWNYCGIGQPHRLSDKT